MITALTWVPKGAARVKPVRFELSQEEYARIKMLAKAEEDIEKEAEKADVGEGDEPEHSASGLSFSGDVKMNEDEEDMTELPPELRMDEYDDDSEHEDNDEENDDFAVSCIILFCSADGSVSFWN
jgi:periodic tryptophan protein 1